MRQLHRELVLHNVEGLAADQDVYAEQQPDGTYLVQFRVTSEAIAMTLEVLRLVAAVGGRIYTALDRAQIAAKTEASKAS